MLKIICFVFYGRTYQISLLRMLLDQFNKKELQDEQSARKWVEYWVVGGGLIVIICVTADTC